MTDASDRPGYSFDPGPPPEASRFLRNKGLRPSFSWKDVEPEEHAVAFAVAKVAELDLLEAMRAEVQRALDEGLTFESFQKSWRANPRLAEWWGRKAVEDPLTGAVVEAQLGSPRRLRTIYDANLRSARAAGQWERIERTQAAFPFLEYRLGPSEKHRPHHEDKAGLILPVDAPFWDEWMPPNGWGCKCWVRQVTKAEAGRRGVSDAPEVPDRKWYNERTGDTQLVPQGIDPGWQRNPGKLRRQAAEGLLRDRLEAAPEAVRQAALADIATSWAAERVLAGTSAAVVPVAVLPPALAASLGLGSGLVRMTTAPGSAVVARTAGVETADLAGLAARLASGAALLDDRSGDPAVYVLQDGDGPWVLTLKVLRQAGEIWVEAVERLSAARRRAIRATPGLRKFGGGSGD
jgi:hypothetical protein